MKQIRGKYLMVLIAACGMIAASLGMVTNVSGLFFTPIAEELRTGRGNVSLTLTISNLTLAICGMAVPRLVNSKNFKLLVILGAILFSGGTAGLATASSLGVLYILSGIRGFSAGLVSTVTATMLINNWFRSNTGVVTSIAMGCSGLAGALLSPILTPVIESAGWRMGYLAAGVITAALLLPAILFPITFQPEDSGMKPLGAGTNVETREIGSSGKTISISLFLMITVFAVIGSLATAYPSHFSGMAETYGFTATVGSLMLSVCMVLNTSGKLFFGILADRLGAKKSLLAYGTLVCTGVALILFVHVKWAMFPAAGCFGLSYSLSTVGLVLVIKELFGLENYSKVYPKINLAATAANAIGSSLVGFLYDASGAYTSALFLLLGLMAVLLALVLAAYRGHGAHSIVKKAARI